MPAQVDVSDSEKAIRDQETRKLKGRDAAPAG